MQLLVVVVVVLIAHLLANYFDAGRIRTSKTWLILMLTSLVGAAICFILNRDEFLVIALPLIAIGLSDGCFSLITIKEGEVGIVAWGFRGVVHGIFLILMIAYAVIREINRFQSFMVWVLVGIGLIIVAPLWYGFYLAEKDG